MEKLRIEISGDSKDLQKEIDKAVKELKQFEKVAEKSIGGIEKPSKKGAKGIKSLGGASANATPALLEFNRTIQDAPFGIQGVANNIQQLTANFGYLKTQTGSTKNALKAMLAGLSGPQGILLAVSLVTALMVTFSNSMGRTASKAKKLTDETEKANNKIKDYIKSLSAVDQALIKGAQSAQSQIVKLNSLRQISEDTARSTTDRKKAIQELRRLFPDYFKELDDEKIKSGNLADTYDVLTASILKRAKATALQSAIVKNAENELEVSRLLTDEAKKRSKLQSDKSVLFPLGAPSEFANSLGVAAGKGRGAFDALTGSIEDSTEEIGTLNAALANISKDSEDLIERFQSLGGIDLSKIKLKGDGEANLKIRSNLELLPLSSETLQSLNESASNAADTLQGILDKSTKKIQINFESDQIKRAGKTLSNGLIGVKDDMTLAIEGFDKQLNNTIENGIANTLGGLGEAIGNALSGGANAIEAVGAVLLGSLGSMMVQLGKQAIITGITIEAVKKALATLNGIGAIAAGVALVAVGSAFSSKSRDLGSNLGSSGGGSVSSGGSSSSGSFSSSGGGFGNGNVVFEISGRNLVGVLRRNTDSNLAING